MLLGSGDEQGAMRRQGIAWLQSFVVCDAAIDIGYSRGEGAAQDG
jgi:hypothetical protein